MFSRLNCVRSDHLLCNWCLSSPYAFPSPHDSPSSVHPPAFLSLHHTSHLFYLLLTLILFLSSTKALHPSNSTNFLFLPPPSTSILSSSSSFQSPFPLLAHALRILCGVCLSISLWWKKHDVDNLLWEKVNENCIRADDLRVDSGTASGWWLAKVWVASYFSPK